MFDEKTESINENIEFSKINLQKLFIELTGGEG